jgi:hypothetical protein
LNTPIDNLTVLLQTLSDVVDINDSVPSSNTTLDPPHNNLILLSGFNNEEELFLQRNKNSPQIEENNSRSRQISELLSEKNKLLKKESKILKERRERDPKQLTLPTSKEELFIQKNKDPDIITMIPTQTSIETNQSIDKFQSEQDKNSNSLKLYKELELSISNQLACKFNFIDQPPIINLKEAIS